MKSDLCKEIRGQRTSGTAFCGEKELCDALRSLFIDKEYTVTSATYSLCSMTFVIGREFFVGLSKRTNQRGAEILADTFKVGKG